MKLLSVITSFAVITLSYSAPTEVGKESEENDKTLVVDNDFYPDELIVYTGEHEIVNIMVPLNHLNYADDDSDEDDNDHTNTVLFFVEADIDENGERLDQGLFIKNGSIVTKLLEHGRDASAAHEPNSLAYFGAKDGIYVYNAENNTADKYGSVTDSIIQILKKNGSDEIYILTEDKEIFSVTKEGQQKIKLADLPKAEQIALDFSNNLYLIGDDKKTYVTGTNGTKQIVGLPENASYIKLLRPPFIIDQGVPLILDEKLFLIYANGTVESTLFEIRSKPSAYAMEAALLQYYARDKKIYEYNILSLILTGFLEGIRDFLNEQKNTIEQMASRSRSNLRP